MQRARLSSLALLAGASLWFGGACGRASNEELLAGKACSASSDCIDGYVCDAAAGVCVRPGYVLTSDPDHTRGDGTAGSGGAAGAAPDAGPAPARDAATTPPSWIPISPPPPEFVAREKAAYAVAGDKVLIWGGIDGSGVHLSTGAIYDLSEDSWQLTSVTAGTPSGRVLANAAWTGSQFLVWGGRLNNGSSEFKDGALYDPQTQEWTSTANQMTARSGALTLGYSTQVLIWGGWNKAGAVLDKAVRYSVAGNGWAPASNDLLGKREHAGWAASGSQLFVLGGRSNLGAALDTAALYEMGTNSWSAQPALPSARFGLFAAHDGTQLWVWGGRDDQQALGNGLLLRGTQWAPTASGGEPSARWAPQRQSGWTCNSSDGRFILAGGHDFADTPQRDGGVYDPATDSWAPVPSAAQDHEWGVGVCVEGTVLLWGGTNHGSVTADGERWAP